MVLAQPRWRSICSPSAATASMSGAGGRIATALAVVLAGVASPELIAGGRALGGAIAAPVAEAAASRAGSAALQKRCRLQLRSKLAKVPVFVVTNDGGSPFLSQIPGGDQSALLFLFPAEAQKMLQGVLKAPNGASSGAKITISNLERAYQLASKPPSFSGLRDQVTNRELTMVWQFAPHAAEVRAAQALMVRSMKAPVAPKLPAYMVNGLAYDKRGKEVRPVFLSQKDAAAAMEQTAAAADGAGVKQEVVVVDLLEMLAQLSHAVSADTAAAEAEISSIEFVPASESVQLRNELKADKKLTKAKVVPPDFRWK
ncbi:hypothetical protein EMIHUDRAFT_448744 [Emiliania huxleyi CCMP1516]|uniref:Uncharacterized protein n=2 Tax=Emiliania huxleyi TaxID=2903 RepID=A0A0D3KZW6_EMIH1|nr:hypothetical protein EMIHUDRAFT_457895 [Emiliania huxleyi CCMP1516]XP_005793730.1 hypothetical protein EMIHUDRAFT_448744 [Emiliania huxleyi CCMP1516]EOD23758.1 hypothetical protein EMIHUDRAFT_457895 [Emiliania huxleyi CCMP1516]EOD41301.1 hypothetical protein EMIHUDRAFT_448744 [Emiliania huxleyi CCMP1516]|mmetsp:Transcript_39400/g.127632  ORF Transcript_39400/g.127632 Transcript_39400/m.127632 type:complete len:314 (-) Transcript_39400:184-1125(-)|eukprot:XP_005776187.1 hypothetical protein EMIHUDRAFT_457895 [Emiliania huxleyi CCMP1516]